MRVLDRDAHLLERENRVAAQVGSHVERRQIKVAALVEHLGAVGVLEVVVLQLRADVHDVAHLFGACGLALEHVARIAVEVLPFGRFDRAEHARHGVALGAPREDLEGGRLGVREHVRLAVQREAANAAAVEAHALLERVLELARDNGKRLHMAQHVAEPKAHEMNVAALDRFEDEVLIGAACHRQSFPWGFLTCFIIQSRVLQGCFGFRRAGRACLRLMRQRETETPRPHEKKRLRRAQPSSHRAL